MIRRGLPEAFEPNAYHRTPQRSVLPCVPAMLPLWAFHCDKPVDRLRSPFMSYRPSSDFVPDDAGHNGRACADEGPVSNTGLTGSLGGDRAKTAFGVCIDYLTLVMPESHVLEQGQTTQSLLGYLFGSKGLMATELRAKQWQFYSHSAYIHDPEGNTVGRIGRGGNRDTWCVSLTGEGCRLVEDWRRVQVQADNLAAHISRVDVAFDDYSGLVFDIHSINAMAKGGEFNGNGKPPVTRFIDDHGSGKGCTVYVGGKGRKELCAYEKGKKFGDPESPWVRIELRLWSRNCVLPLDVLSYPERFLRGSYKVLDERLPIVKHPEAARPEYTRREVDATAEACKRFLKQQCGPMLHMMWSALGPSAEEWFKEHVFRNTVPARFKGKGGDRESLYSLLREELGYAFVAPF
ncbi:replication initiation factor domain-containing protein [Luteibacter sp. PPL554]